MTHEMTAKTIERAPETPRIGSGTYNLSKVRKRCATPLTHATLQRFLKKDPAHWGYVITDDARTRGMCIATQRGVAAVTVTDGTVRSAVFTYTAEGTTVTLTEEMACWFLKEWE